MKRILATTLVVVLSAGLAACGNDDDSGSEGGPRIAFLAGVVDATYTPAQEEGLKQGSGGTVTTFNPQFDPTMQLKQCQDAISSQRYDAIVLTPLDNSSSLPCARAADAADIPLIVDGTAIGEDLNSTEPQVDGVDFSLVWVPETFAKQTWEMIQATCEGESDCPVVMEISFLGDPLFDALVEYVKAESEGTGIRVVATYESHYDPAETTAKLRDVLLAHPETKVITFANDPTAIAGAEQVKKLGKQGEIQLISDGGTQVGIDAVRDGTLYGTVPILPQTAATIEGEMALKAINGEDIDPVGMDGFGLGDAEGPITAQNVDEFKAEW